MKVVRSRAEFQSARPSLRGTVCLVPTMGALHAGHASLLGVARTAAHAVVATIFVNPLQFGANEDLARYPRTLEADLALCEQLGVDLVWVPSVEDVYPTGPARVRVSAGPLGDDLEGASRPGHFDGVLTVVGKFLHLVRPDLACFGQKDYQQLCLIERMVDDLDFAVALVAVPTVREDDGLALSSRNAYLSADERRRAVALSRALDAGARAAAAHDDPLAAARAELDGVDVDYLALRGADLGPPPAHGLARLLVAARFGRTRLIDNAEIVLG